MQDKHCPSTVESQQRTRIVRAPCRVLATNTITTPEQYQYQTEHHWLNANQTQSHGTMLPLQLPQGTAALPKPCPSALSPQATDERTASLRATLASAYRAKVSTRARLPRYASQSAEQGRPQGANVQGKRCEAAPNGDDLPQRTRNARLQGAIRPQDKAPTKSST